MVQSDFAKLAAEYEKRTDEQLVHLLDEKDQLTPEAREALTVTLEARGIQSHTDIEQFNLESDIAAAKRIDPSCATMNQRFWAHLLDLTCVLIVFVMLDTVANIRGINLPNGRISWFLMFAAYMSCSLIVFGNTLGKYLVALKIQPSDASKTRLNVDQILIRETIGRLVSSFLFGAGYWLRTYHPQRQAWSDSMAHTVVRNVKSDRIGKG